MGPVAPRTFLVPSTGWHAARSWKVVEVSGGTWGGAGTPATRGRLPGVSGSFLESVERSPQHPAPSVAPPPRPSPRPPSIEHRASVSPHALPTPSVSAEQALPSGVTQAPDGPSSTGWGHGRSPAAWRPRALETSPQPSADEGSASKLSPSPSSQAGDAPTGAGGAGLWARCSQAAQSQAAAASGPLPPGQHLPAAGSALSPPRLTL